MKDQTESWVFTDDEVEQMNELRRAYEGMTERDKFVVREALKVYFEKKK